MNAFDVVRQFEKTVAEFAGAKYAVAVNTGTSAIFLSLKYCGKEKVTCPARTFVSVPMAVLQAGCELELEDFDWKGVYQLKPHPVFDGALRFRKGMYQGGLHCLSFHARKILNIGEGGMVLTDDEKAAEWIRRASYSGRKSPDFKIEDITEMGWQYYMNPEKAARGLHLMTWIGDEEDQVIAYPDLRKAPVFQ